MNSVEIELFLHTQVKCWNAGDKTGFMAAYRQAAEGGLTIEYVGRDPADGWTVLEAMWERQNSAVEIEVQVIINGNEAACHNRNKSRGSDKAVETIEVYRFDPGQRLAVRYFIRQP